MCNYCCKRENTERKGDIAKKCLPIGCFLMIMYSFYPAIVGILEVVNDPYHDGLVGGLCVFSFSSVFTLIWIHLFCVVQRKILTEYDFSKR